MRPPVLFAVAALALAAPLLAQTPVYSLPGETGGTFTYLTISEEAEYADSINLAGTGRFQLEDDGLSILNLNQLVFANLHTLVPDDLSWAVKFEDLSNSSADDAFGSELEDTVNLEPTAAGTDPSRPDLHGAVSDGEWIPISISTEAPPTSTPSLELTANAIPEPSAALLLAAGASLAWRRRRR